MPPSHVSTKKRARPFARVLPTTANDDDDDDDDRWAKDSVERHGRTIYFYAEVTAGTVLKLKRLLDEAACEAVRQRCEHVTLHIHSWGGCAFSGLDGYDAIRACRVAVHTVACGFVASAATFLLLGGHRRFAQPHSCLLIHQLSTGLSGKLAELVQEVSNSQALMRIIESIYEENTYIDKRALASMLARETMLSFSQSLHHGFIEGAPETTDANEGWRSARPRGSDGRDGRNTHIRWDDHGNAY